MNKKPTYDTIWSAQENLMSGFQCPGIFLKLGSKSKQKLKIQEKARKKGQTFLCALYAFGLDRAGTNGTCM